MNDSKSLAHTKWNCKYHIVFSISPTWKYTKTHRFHIAGIGCSGYTIYCMKPKEDTK